VVCDGFAIAVRTCRTARSRSQAPVSREMLVEHWERNAADHGRVRAVLFAPPAVLRPARALAGRADQLVQHDEVAFRAFPRASTGC